MSDYEPSESDGDGDMETSAKPTSTRSTSDKSTLKSAKTTSTSSASLSKPRKSARTKQSVRLLKETEQREEEQRVARKKRGTYGGGGSKTKGGAAAAARKRAAHKASRNGRESQTLSLLSGLDSQTSTLSAQMEAIRLESARKIEELQNKMNVLAETPGGGNESDESNGEIDSNGESSSGNSEEVGDDQPILLEKLKKAQKQLPQSVPVCYSSFSVLSVMSRIFPFHRTSLPVLAAEHGPLKNYKQN